MRRDALRFAPVVAVCAATWLVINPARSGAT